MAGNPACVMHFLNAFKMISGLNLVTSFRISFGTLSGPGALFIFREFVACLSLDSVIMTGSSFEYHTVTEFAKGIGYRQYLIFSLEC